MTAEFKLIDQFFAQQGIVRDDVPLNIGDDCAILNVPAGKSLVVTTDTMVENSHFYPNIAPFDLGYKAVATNLSDLAAMGAQPAWVSLALTLPNADAVWLEGFSRGMFDILNAHNVQLIGGDTTSGAVPTITITAQGFIDQTQKSTPNSTALFPALCRHQANVGDWIYVSGTIGDGLAGFYLLRDQYQGKKSAVNADEEYLIRRNLHPTPRIALGQALLKNQLSRCALDLSDGLVGDLGHILARSSATCGETLGAEIYLEHLPCSDALLVCYGRENVEKLALQGGEDYELCFTVPDHKKAELAQYADQFGVPVTCIGRIVKADSLAHSTSQSSQIAVKFPIIFKRHGTPVDLQIFSFEHFNE